MFYDSKVTLDNFTKQIKVEYEINKLDENIVEKIKKTRERENNNKFNIEFKIKEFSLLNKDNFNFLLYFRIESECIKLYNKQCIISNNIGFAIQSFTKDDSDLLTECYFSIVSEKCKIYLNTINLDIGNVQLILNFIRYNRKHKFKSKKSNKNYTEQSYN